MLRVLMADDERVILRGLKKLINWEKLGLSCIGEVYRGDTLLKEIVEHTPDIVITDISMPGMNGIEVLKSLRNLGIQTKVIFISAYREFSYAQEALSYGAVDYLIKPIDPYKLEQILIKTVTSISEVNKIDMISSQFQHYEVKLKKQKIIDFLENLTEEKKLSDMPDVIHELNRGNHNAIFSVIAIEADHIKGDMGSCVEWRRKLLYFAIKNVIEELVPIGVEGWAISNRIYLYMVLKHDQDFDIEDLASQFHSHIGRLLKTSVSIGIGTPGSLRDIPESYEEAKIGINYKFFLGVNGLISYSSIPTIKEKKEMDREKLEKDLLKALYSTISEIPTSLLDIWEETIKCLAWGNRDYAINLSVSMLNKALREMPSEVIELESEELRYMLQLNECETFEEMNRYFRNELGMLQMKIHQKGSGKEVQQITQVKSYIDEHYQEEISLETMAVRFYMNPYYFSVFFKKHTGQNFKAYVTEIRMKHAMQMLIETDDMLYRIAENVGYHNARQFSELFKKYYGILPNEYRKQYGGDKKVEGYK
ncbi:response regulator [Paenibacillus sp. FA6]|uniref:response regulator n=1 Tax=Paenibacillus sp. FA6 TaxID=3413029 RepID=UPI003F656139